MPAVHILPWGLELRSPDNSVSSKIYPSPLWWPRYKEATISGKKVSAPPVSACWRRPARNSANPGKDWYFSRVFLSILPQLNRIAWRIWSASASCFCRVNKGAKVIWGEQYHTNSFKPHKKSGIKSGMDHELVLKVSRMSSNEMLVKSLSNSGVISAFLRWYMVLKRMYVNIPMFSFQG